MCIQLGMNGTLKMKRSEMIQIMMNVFECDSDDSRWMSEHNADRVLRAMEEAGMIPPYIDKWIEGHLCTENKWEPENEDDKD